MAHWLDLETLNFQTPVFGNASSDIENSIWFLGLFSRPSGQGSWDRKANELLARMSKALDRKAGSATRNLDYMFF